MAAATATIVTTGATAGGPPNPQGQRTTGGQPKPREPQPRIGQSQQIASSVLDRDFKFTLTALRSQADPLLATVRLRVFTFQGGAWKESDRATVGAVDSFFWFPLTGRHAVCEFSTAGTEPAPVAVSRLNTPSVGCSPTENFRIEDGRIVTAGEPPAATARQDPPTPTTSTSGPPPPSGTGGTSDTSV
ncbi:hypothetical protein [Streptomyces sp.]|uniref:hypothetical protein n=1 Tax=Streptomyces sp. TaxID=1931 RepID=UPI002F3E5968